MTFTITFEHKLEKCLIVIAQYSDGFVLCIYMGTIVPMYTHT